MSGAACVPVKAGIAFCEIRMPEKIAAGGQFDHRSHLDIRSRGVSRPESRHGLQHFRTAIDEERQGLLLMPGVEKC